MWNGNLICLFKFKMNSQTVYKRTIKSIGIYAASLLYPSHLVTYVNESGEFPLQQNDKLIQLIYALQRFKHTFKKIISVHTKSEFYRWL
jgi:hypothetical protein